MNNSSQRLRNRKPGMLFIILISIGAALLLILGVAFIVVAVKFPYEQYVLQVMHPSVDTSQATPTGKSIAMSRQKIEPTASSVQRKTQPPKEIPSTTLPSQPSSPAPTPTPTPVPPLAPALAPVHTTVVDNLNNWGASYAHTGNLAFDCNNSQHMNGDACAIYRLSNTSEAVTWHLQGMTYFQVTAYILSGEPVDPFSFYVSQNGSSWTAVSAGTAFSMGQGGTWSTDTSTLSGLAKVNYVKVVFPIIGDGNYYTPQIGKVVFSN